MVTGTDTTVGMIYEVANINDTSGQQIKRIRGAPHRQRFDPGHGPGAPCAGLVSGEVAAAVNEMPYGIYIVGSVRGTEPNGMIADWVMQVALRPRLVAVSFENDSHSLASIRENGAFSVNLLAHNEGDDLALAQHFVQPHRAAKVKGRGQPFASSTYRKLEAVEYTTTPRGCPLLTDALMWLDCTAEQFIAVGDHTVVAGRAIDGKMTRSGEPLSSADLPWTYSG